MSSPAWRMAWFWLTCMGAGSLIAMVVGTMVGRGPRHRRWRHLARPAGAELRRSIGRRILAHLSPSKSSGDAPLRWATMLPWMGMAAAGGVAGSLLLRSPAALPLGGAVVLTILRRQATRREVDRAARVREEFPDALLRMASHLRAGQSLAQAVEAVAASGSGPLEQCLSRALADYRCGMPLIQALSRLEREFPGEATTQFQQVLDIYRLSGGNLAEVLDNAASALAEHQSLLGELEAKTAEARLSARILLALPFVLGMYFWFASPEMLRPLWETPAGRVGSIYGTASWLVGRELMNRLIAGVRAERG